MKPDKQRPPIYTVWEEFCGWTFDRTAAVPKSQRLSFGQRIDALELIPSSRLAHPEADGGDLRGRVRAGWPAFLVQSRPAIAEKRRGLNWASVIDPSEFPDRTGSGHAASPGAPQMSILTLRD